MKKTCENMDWKTKTPFTGLKLNEGLDIDYNERPQLVHKHDLAYECILCQNLLRDPIQLACGHRICTNCMLLDNTCPASCDRPISSGTHFYDKGIQRQLDELEMYCYFKNRGCSTICAWKDLISHVNECLYARYTCKNYSSGCKEQSRSATQYNEHKAICKFNPKTCEKCVSYVPGIFYDMHLQTCCRRTTGDGSCADDGNNNTTDAETQLCSFKWVGCPYTGTPKLLIQHLASSTEIHDALMSQYQSQINLQIKELTIAQDQLSTDIHLLRDIRLENIEDKVRKICASTKDRSEATVDVQYTKALERRFIVLQTTLEKKLSDMSLETKLNDMSIRIKVLENAHRDNTQFEKRRVWYDVLHPSTR